MIAWLQGRIVDRPTEGRIVIDVHGVGYDVELSLQTFFRLSAQTETIQLHIHTIVREDAFLLYGFIDTAERALFRSLIKVNGIGPKVAMTILSSVTPEDFYRCVQDNQLAALTHLPGIGKKTAERLLIEMRDKVFDLSGLPSAEHEAIQALLALGYRQQEAQMRVKKVDKTGLSCEALIKEALKQ